MEWRRLEGNERHASKKKKIGLIISKNLVSGWDMDESRFLHNTKVPKAS